MTDASASSFRWSVLLISSVSAMCAMMNLIAFSPLIGEIARDLRLNLGSASLGLVAVPTLATAVGIACSGFVIDVLGLFPVMIAGQLLLVLSTAAIPWLGHNFTALFVIRIAQGLASAGLTAAITPAIALWFPRGEIGRAMGFTTIGSSVGIMLGLNVAPTLSAALHSWRDGTGVLAGVALIALLITLPIAARSKRERINTDIDAAPAALPAVGFFRWPLFWIGLLILSFSAWANIAFGDLSPGFLAVAPPIGAGYGARTAGLLVSATSLTGMIGAPVAGFLIDKIFRGESRPVVMIGWIMGAVCFAVILLPVIHSHEVALFAVLLIAGLQNPFVNVGLLSFAAKVFSPHIVGRICGLWISVSFFTGAAGVTIGSLLLRTTGDYGASIAGLGVVSLIGLVVSILLRRPNTPLHRPPTDLTAGPATA